MMYLSRNDRRCVAALKRLGVTVEECEEMMRHGIMLWMVAAQAYSLLWQPTSGNEKNLD